MNSFLNNLTEAFAWSIAPWVTLVRHLPWFAIGLQIVLVWIAVYLIHRFGTGILRRMAAPFPFSRRIVEYTNNAGRVVVFLLFMQVILRDSGGALGHIAMVQHLGALLLIASFTWLAVRCVRAIADTVIELNPAHTGPDNLQARRIQTQARVMSRSLMVLIVVVGSGMALSTLPLLRQFGASLLASAGVAGLVVGFAAKPVLGNLLAGLQLAVTQPIRLDDVVIVQNEWGWIEEITGAYVVIRIWDQRRLVVPLQWFIENPFQNWTRTNADLLGTVEIWTDFSLPVEELRSQATAFCHAAPEWDGRLCLTQVIDANERAMRVRVLVSAADAGRCWDLRCRIRENLIGYIQKTYPDSLPRLRTSLPVGSPLQKTGDAFDQHGPSIPPTTPMP